jgi:DNA-directed RNA polymerase specialized sigma24 family protein
MRKEIIIWEFAVGVYHHSDTDLRGCLTSCSPPQRKMIIYKYVSELKKQGQIT